MPLVSGTSGPKPLPRTDWSLADLAYNFFKGDAKTTPAALAPVKVKKLRREKAKVSSHFFFLVTSPDAHP